MLGDQTLDFLLLEHLEPFISSLLNISNLSFPPSQTSQSPHFLPHRLSSTPVPLKPLKPLISSLAHPLKPSSVRTVTFVSSIVCSPLVDCGVRLWSKRTKDGNQEKEKAIKETKTVSLMGCGEGDGVNVGGDWHVYGVTR